MREVNITHEQWLEQRVAKLEEALGRLAVSGTHHDPMPTRKLYHPTRDAAAFECDCWWQDYFMSAHNRVRELAKEALK